jgi:Domain of unknown function (DUF4915)
MTTDPTTTPSAEPPLRSIHTTNFGPLLSELGVSLLITTYQAGDVGQPPQKTRIVAASQKKDGGVLLDVAHDEILAQGLSMPHSPRWYAGKLWVLNSGQGSQGGLGVVDPATGKYEEVASLPGFTRGLDFVGPLAFVGLSQVRESAVFSGIAIAERPVVERCCGVWVVHLETGQVVAFVKFEDARQEIFAVQVLPRRRPDVLNDVWRNRSSCRTSRWRRWPPPSADRRGTRSRKW